MAKSFVAHAEPTSSENEILRELPKLTPEGWRAVSFRPAEPDRDEWLDAGALLDPECDSPQLEVMLLEAVRGPHAQYSRKELEAVLE